MFEDELDKLFLEDELINLLEFMNNHIWYKIDGKRYIFANDVQTFILSMEANDRKENILRSCIEDYPQILGLKKENI